MRIFNLILIIVCANSLLSCKNNHFDVTSYRAEILSDSIILNLDITDDYLYEIDKTTRRKYVSNENSARTLRVKNPEEYKKRDSSILSNDYQIESQETDRIEEIRNSLKDLKGIKSNIEINNTTNEIIENSYLTVLIKFKFENKNFYYLKPYKLLSNKTWKPNETLSFNLNDITSFAVGNPNAVKIHKPEKVEIQFYLTANNSIGFNNLDAEKETRVNGFYSSQELTFGKLINEEISQEQLLGLGKHIYSQDITSKWNN